MTISPANYKSIFIVLGCVIAAAALIIFGIFPNYQYNKKIDQQISIAEQELKTKNLFFPIYKELVNQVQLTEKHKKKSPPAIKPAKPKKIEQFFKLMTDIAAQNKMTLKQIAPDKNIYRNTSNKIGLNVTVIGDFFHFRQLLLQLCFINFIQDIESIRIYTNDQNHTFDMRLNLIQE